MFDAYTIRKVLPRMLIAIILISLSWPLLHLVVNFFNALGNGVRALIQEPFKELIEGSGGVNLGETAVSLGGLGAVALGIGLGIMGILSFAVTALIAVGVAFTTLVIRQILVLLLAVVVPFAIACYILPNTESIWKRWRDLFIRALVVFPIISAFIAIGRVFAAVSGTAGGLLGGIIAFVAYFGPYFMLPMAFKMAGGAIAGVSGALNNAAGGMQQGLKGYRKKEFGKKVHDLKTGDRFQNRNMVTRAFNRRSSGLAGGWRAAHFGFGRRGESYHNLHGRAAGEDAVRENANLRQLGFNDDGIAAMALSGGTAAGARTRLRQLGWEDERIERAMSAASSVGFNSSNATGAMTLMAQNKSRALAGAFAGNAGMQIMRDSAMQLAQGNEDMVDDLMGGFAFNSRGAGRLDLGGETADASTFEGWGRSTTQQHAQAFTASTQYYAEEFSGQHVERDAAGNITARSGIQSANQVERQNSAIALMEMQNMLPGATEENQRAINTALHQAGVRHEATRIQKVMQPDHSVRDVEVPITVEEQLANIASGLAHDDTSNAPRVVTAQQIRGLARVYDQSVPIAERGGPPDPNATATKPPGT